MAKTHEIVVLGANFGGLSVAHYLLNNTIPALKSLGSSKSFHLTLVGPANAFYYKIALPRVIASPELIPQKEVVLPFEEAFNKHKDTFTFVQGLAKALDPNSKTVTVGLTNGGTESVSYDSLVIATGTHTANPIWTVNDDLTATKAVHEEIREGLPKAKTILIAGAGPAGVETAGEIAEKYKSAKVTLLSGGARVLPRLAPATSGRAEAMLKGLGAEVLHNVRVTSSTPSAEHVRDVTLYLDDGTSRKVDVYIDATGGKPNTDFLPPAWLDPQTGKVKVDFDSLRAESVPGVYAIGDVASASLGGVLDINHGVHPVCTSVGRDIAAGLDASTDKAFKLPALKERKFKVWRDSQFVPVGRSQGVGQLFGYRLPSAMVWFVKGRTYFLEKARPAMLGLDYMKP